MARSVLRCLYLMLSIFNISCHISDICRLCKCKDDIVECSNLTYIPQLPKYTRELKFSNNHLPRIDNRTFENITDLDIYLIELNHNNITIIEPNTFRNLQSLTNLSLSGNALNSESLFSLVNEFRVRFQISTSPLLKLILNNISLTSIPDGLFRGLQDVKLNTLDLSHNHLTVVNFKEFILLQQLLALYIDHNKITTIVFHETKKFNIVLLSLQTNSFQTLPNFCDNFPNTPYLKLLSFENNRINKFIPERLNCLKDLKTLNLNLNCINKIQTNHFQHFSSLYNVHLTRQCSTKERMVIQEYAFNNTNLRFIDLFENRLSSGHIHESAFHGCPNLKSLILACNDLRDYKRQRFTKLNKVLVNLVSLEYLDLTEIKLNYIPESIQNLTRLKALDLYRNIILFWPAGFWKNNKMLVHLKLGRNMVTKITHGMFPISLRRRLQYIDLYGNPIECSCDNLWFINWMKENSNLFFDYPVGYRCLNMTEKVCLKDNPFYTSITGVSCILLVILTITSIIYKYRWLIKYQIYIFRHKPKLLNNMAEQLFMYDIFVSYCGEDSDWVLDKLVPNLEQDSNLKLCIHDRDFQAGRLIIDNIVESIENSRRVLIILSNNFARSEWCQFEMTLAQKHVLNRATEPLRVVLLEDIDSGNMSNSLHALLKTTTYLTWYDDIQQIHLFWERLKRCLTNN